MTVHRRKRLTVPVPKKKGYTYEEMFSEYWDPIHRAYFASIRDYHMAEDLTQEAMARIWRYWPKIQPGKMGGAIAVIVNHVRYDYLSKNFDKPDKDFYEDLLEFEQHDEGITDPVRVLINDVAYEAICEFAEVLEDKERELLFDFYIHNVDVKEICEKFGMAKGNVYTHLHRIREHLNNCYERYDLVPDGTYNTGAL